MDAIPATANDRLQIVPSAASSNTDFDFLFGRWNIQNRKLKKRLQNCDEWIEFESKCKCGPILHGFGNTDKFTAAFDSGPFAAITLRLFNPKTRLWSIYWADSNVVVLDVGQVGSFAGPTGEFLAHDVWEGTPVIVKFHWDKTDPERPVWSQAFSADNGKSWEWNWYMAFSKVK